MLYTNFCCFYVCRKSCILFSLCQSVCLYVSVFKRRFEYECCVKFLGGVDPGKTTIYYILGLIYTGDFMYLG